MSLEGLPPELRQALAATDLDEDDDLYDVGAGIPRPVRWATLSPAAAHEAWNRLIPWVGWLTTRYGLSHIIVPQCWPWHGALVEELTALHGAYEVAYNPTQAATAMLEWHAMFAMCRTRLTEWNQVSRCNLAEHRDVPPQPWPESPQWLFETQARLDRLYGDQT